MTNEELALQIQAGQVEYLAALWFQVEGFIRSQISKFFFTWQDRCASTFVMEEDLYQSAYFALQPAVDYFDNAKGFKFLTILKYFLKRCLLTEIGVTYSGNKRYIKPIDDRSLDECIYESEGSEVYLSDTVIDKSAEQAFTRLENAEYITQLHDNLEQALSVLKEREALIIRNHYYLNMSIADLADTLNVSRGRADVIRRHALNTMRKQSVLNEYREDLIARLAYRTSYKKFKETQSSQVEYIVCELDDKERKLGLR